VACRVLGLPLVNLYDYDPNPANHLAFRLARRVIVPAPFPDAALRRFGAARKAVRYPGVKEQVYLSGFAGDPGFRTRHGWRDGDVMVVMRPPSDWSPYHRFPNPLFDALVRHAAAQEGVQIVFLPRIAEQAEQIRTLALSNLTVPTHAFDGPDLVHHADLVISAGGTMNREAAVLGTPAYTAYAGELGATDRHLMALGRLTHIRSAEEFGRIAFAARDRRAVPLAGEQLVSTIADQILA
jgi:predicted glycosyltransferase